jgi:hypothetical protein
MKIVTGIASTTHIDRHFERFAKSALDGMTEQIKAKYIPNNIEHDSNRQNGVILYGEVFQLSDGEYGLGVVVGQFEKSEERVIYNNGSKNTVWKKYKSLLDIDELIKMQASLSPDTGPHTERKRSELSLEELLDIHISSTQVTPDGVVYKIKKHVATTDDLKIEVYPKDHEHQPHFHVISKQRGINARFDINTLEVISMKRGTIKARDIKKIQSFFESEPMRKKLKEEHARLN